MMQISRGTNRGWNGPNTVSLPTLLLLRQALAASKMNLYRATETALNVAKIQFVDQTPELENYYALHDTDTVVGAIEGENGIGSLRDMTSPSQKTGLMVIPRSHRRSASAGNDTCLLPANSGRDTTISEPNRKRRRTNDSANGAFSLSGPFQPTSSYRLSQSAEMAQTLSINAALIGSNDSPQLGTSQAVEAEYRRLADTAAAAIPSASSGLLSPEVWRKKFFWPVRKTLVIECGVQLTWPFEE